MKLAITTWSVTALLSTLPLACSHEKPPAAPTPAEPRATLAASTEPPGREEQPQNPRQEERRTTVSESITRQCSLPDTPENSPHFDFDRSALRPRGIGILDDVAKCMQNGPLKDKSITVTGYADPRGTDDYNYALGTRRAVSARDYLISNGVPSNLIEVRSRGEMDATGTDETSWQLDRRVEVVETTSSPGK
jgi:peptidoglycan-associated lipoprotein